MLGLTAYFKRLFPNVGFFKPIGTEPYQDSIPRNVVLMRQVFDLKDEPADMYGIGEDAAFQLLSKGKHTDVLDTVYQKLSTYQAGKDLVVINGWKAGGFAFNAELAAHIDAPILLSMDYLQGESPASTFNRAMAEVQEYRAARCSVLGVAVSGVPRQLHAEVATELRERLSSAGVRHLGTFPVVPELTSLALDQVFDTVRGRLLFTDRADVQLGTAVGDYYVVTSHSGTMLNHLPSLSRPLLLTTPDRIDTITTALAAHAAGVAPLAGVLITGHDGRPSPFRAALRAMSEGLERLDRGRAGESQQFRLPLITTELDCYSAIKAIQSADPAILPTSAAKIEAAQAAFEEHVDGAALSAAFAGITDKLTPAKFLHGMRQACKRAPQRIVLPESEDHRVLMAASQAQGRGLAHVVLLGNQDHVLQEAAKLGISLEGVEVVDPATAPQLGRYTDELVTARRKKGLSHEAAADLLKDINYFATMMVRCGDADGLVSGAAHTTAATVRPAMQVLKDPDMPLISSIFFMCLPDKVLVYGDCAVNVDPDSEQLARIAIASADTAAAFGLEPRVAMLSFSTLGSGSGPQVQKVTEAVRIAKELRPELRLSGPMQYDAATNARVAAVKVKGDTSGVAGQANVLIFPDLNTGNNTYKAVQQASRAVAMGPVMQGIAGAVNDLSRGCTVADILDTICATSLQAQFKKKKDADKQ